MNDPDEDHDDTGGGWYHIPLWPYLKGEVAAVRSPVALARTGDASTRQIAGQLNAEGIRLPSFKTGWRADTVAQILGNPAYIAMTFAEGRTQRLSDQVAAQWPALVDGLTWDSVQAKLGRFHRKGGRTEQATGKERAYAFQGLVRCLTCGGPMHCHWMGGRPYYRCRGELANGCRGVRDDYLRDWARGLMVWIETQVDIKVTFTAAPKREKPRVSLARIDESIERLGQRFEWGDVDEATYRGRLADYRALKAEAVAALERAQEAAVPRPWPTNLVEAWDAMTTTSKRRQLAFFFEEIELEGGRVRGLKLRPIHAALAEIIEQYRGSSPGGIRTRDISLERAAS